MNQVFTLFMLVVSAIGLPQAIRAQGLSSATPAQEYIRLNGQLVAVDNSPGGNAVTGAAPGWLDQQIGGTQSSATYGSHSYLVTGGGTGLRVGAHSDQMGLAYLSVSNDFQITVHLSTPGTATTAGIIIRDSLDPGAQYAFVGLANGALGTGLARQTPGAPTPATCNTSGALSGSPSSGSPSYFMLQRFGETVFVYASNDGKTWTSQCGQLRFTMRPNVLVGLVAASGSNSTTSTATFNSVVVDSLPPFFSMGAYMAGDYFVLQNVGSGKVLDGYNNNTPIQWGFNDGTIQHWAPVMFNGYFYVASRTTNKVLTSAGISSGSGVTQTTQQYSDPQLWMMHSSDGRSVSLVNKNSGLALHVKSTADGLVVDEVTYNSTDTMQQWRLLGTTGSAWAEGVIATPDPVVAANTTATNIWSLMYTGQVGFGVYGLGAYTSGYSDSSQVYAAGSLVSTGGNTPVTQTVQGLGEGTQLILTEGNLGFAISTTTVHLYPPPDTTNFHAIQNKHSQLYLHVSGTSVIQSATSGALEWKFVPAGAASDGITPVYKIQNTNGGYLGILGAATAAQAYLTVSSSSDASQTWIVKPGTNAAYASGSTFELENVNSTAANGSMVAEPGATYNWSGSGSDPSLQQQSVWQAALIAGDNQQWILD